MSVLFFYSKAKEQIKKARKKEMCSLKSNEPGAGIVLMKLDELHSFAGHPFKVERNQELFELRNLGVLERKQ